MQGSGDFVKAYERLMRVLQDFHEGFVGCHEGFTRVL